MGIKRHKPEEIVAKLRQVEVLVGQGMASIDRLSDTSQGVRQMKRGWSWIGSSLPVNMDAMAIVVL